MQPPTCLDHLGLAVHSLEQASRLYGDVLGLASGGVEEIPEGPDLSFGDRTRVLDHLVGDARGKQDADHPVVGWASLEFVTMRALEQV